MDCQLKYDMTQKGYAAEKTADNSVSG